MEARTEPFRKEHLDAGARLFVAVFGAEPWNEPWTVETARVRLAQILDTPDSLGLFSSVDDGAAGLALGCLWQQAEGPAFYLYELCVRPDLRRRGVGRVLLYRLEDELKARGASHNFLLTSRDGPAEAFYHQSGYRRARDTVALVKDLLPR